MDLVAKIVERLLQELARANCSVAGVWLFGSFARGEARTDSDIDLAVLCARRLHLERVVLMDRLGLLANRDVDVVDLAATSPSLAWDIVTTGRLVAEHDDLAVEEFVRRARWAAEDDEHRSRTILSAQSARSRRNQP